MLLSFASASRAADVPHTVTEHVLSSTEGAMDAVLSSSASASRDANFQHVATEHASSFAEGAITNKDEFSVSGSLRVTSKTLHGRAFRISLGVPWGGGSMGGSIGGAILTT